ncbi:protein kinase domain-containing protein [Streptomyces sp. NPDC003697]
MAEKTPAASGADGPPTAELSADDLTLLGAEPLRRSDPLDIGPYRVLARLGGGGMGRLYLGRKSDTEGAYGAGALVAVKVIRSEYAEDERFRRRFEREIEAVRRVHGTYTAELLDSGFDRDELLWMATAYVPGLSLGDAIERCGPLPAPGVWRLAYEIGQALTAIAVVGVVHRDLKPSNVLIGPDGARIIDFGVAHTVDASSLTMTGQQLGTPAFMSPEQADGGEVGTASDVFSLGSLLAAAITGSAPFGEGTTGDVVHRIIYAAPNEQVLAEAARRDPGLAELIGRCLVKDPLRRPSPQDVVETTRGHATEGQWPDAITETVAARADWRGTAVVVPPMDQLTILRRTKPEDPAKEVTGRRRWPLVAGAAAAVAIMGAAVALGASGGDAAGQKAAPTPAGPHASAAVTNPPPAEPSSPRPQPRLGTSVTATVTAPPYPENQPPGGVPDPARPQQPYDPPPATRPPTSAPATKHAPQPTTPAPTTKHAPPPTTPAKPWKSCTYYSGTTLTVYGQKGSRVKEVQCILKARGYNVGPSGVDGIFGYDTLTEVKRFQSRHHLQADGQVGVKTWAALRS